MRTALRSIILSELVLCCCLIAQDEPLYEELTHRVKSRSFNIGILMQTVADFQIDRTAPGTNGFSIPNLRLIVSGELDDGFGYDAKADFARVPAFLDARMYYTLTPSFIVDVGLFKPHFSKEFLTSAANIDFVNRSTVVARLNPGRQIGMNFRGAVADNVVRYGVGVFNGNRFADNRNDNNDFLVAGRLSVFPNIEGGTVELGTNAAYSRDNNASVAGVPFSGKRLLAGGDVRLTTDTWLFSGEAIFTTLKHTPDTTYKPFGYHVTAGYKLGAKSQILVRWDSFMSDNLGTDTRQIIVGLNVWPTKATEVQINYLINTRDAKVQHHRVLVNAQIAF